MRTKSSAITLITNRSLLQVAASIRGVPAIGLPTCETVLLSSQLADQTNCQGRPRTHTENLVQRAWRCGAAAFRLPSCAGPGPRDGQLGPLLPLLASKKRPQRKHKRRSHLCFRWGCFSLAKGGSEWPPIGRSGVVLGFQQSLEGESLGGAPLLPAKSFL